MVPKFDKDGAPVHMLDDGAPPRNAAAQQGDKAARCDELAQAVRDSGFVRQLRDEGGVTHRKRGRAPQP